MWYQMETPMNEQSLLKHFKKQSVMEYKKICILENTRVHSLATYFNAVLQQMYQMFNHHKILLFQFRRMSHPNK